MNISLLKGLVAFLPASLLFSGSVALFLRERTIYAVLQIVGAGCLLLVVLTHVCEALHLFPWMHWGYERSAGHYADLGCAVFGFTLFPIGYLLHALSLKKSR